MEILSRKLKKKSVIYTLTELVLTFLRNPKKTREKSFTEDNIFFFKFSTASGYGQWEQWSTCSKTCRYLGVAGTRRRTRICEIKELGCDGPEVEVRECNTEDCQGG